MTSRSGAASRTVRAIGPELPRPSDPEPYGAGDTRPRDGLIPKSPQHEAGMRIDPPPSLPRETGCDGRGCAAARAAGRPLGVPRIAAVPVQLRLGHADGAELRRVRLADDDEAGLADPADDGRVDGRHVVGVRLARERRADPAGLVQVLDRDRDAVERPVARRVGLLHDRDVRVHLRVDAVDPLVVELEQLAPRHVACADESSLLESRSERERVAQRRITTVPSRMSTTRSDGTYSVPPSRP